MYVALPRAEVKPVTRASPLRHNDCSHCQIELLGCARLHANRGSRDVALRRKHALSRTDRARWHAIYSRLRHRAAHAWQPLRPPQWRLSPPETHILVTHYHWDHIQGIPFFAPLYAENNHFHFYSFRSKFLGRDSLKQVFETQMAVPYFPVNMSAMNAKRKFKKSAAATPSVSVKMKLSPAG